MAFYSLPEKLEQQAIAIHRKAFVLDTAILMLGFLKDEQGEIQAFLDGGLSGGLMSLSTAETDFAMAMANIGRWKELIRRNPDKLAACASVAELEECKRQGKFGMVIHFQNTKPLMDNLDYLRIFYDLGLRVLQLTYNTQTFVGTGCCERIDAGLTNFGMEVVAECNRLGILVDVSHCAPATSWDAIKHSKAPVAITHSGVYTLAHAYGRNKPDDMMKAVADMGGVMGIPTQPCFVKRDPDTHRVLPSTVEDVLNHVEYAVKLMGIDHVGIGTDMSSYAAREKELPRDSSIRLYRPLFPHVFGVGPTDRYDPFPVGLDSHAEFWNLTRGLLKRGYSEEGIHKILGGNWLRLFKQVWGK